MSSKYPWVILALSLFILGLSLGFFAGKQLSPPQNTMTSTPESKVESNKLFSSQTASLRAVITRIEGRNLSVKNLNNNAVGTITVSDRATVTKAGKITPLPTDLSSLELNQEVLINLEMRNNNYEATSIQYSSALPSLPPVGSNSKIPTNPSAKP
jgi:hypothetical protein